MCQANSNRSMAPRCYGRIVAELTQVTPVLFPLVKESVLVCECLLRQLLILSIAGCACKVGQRPADAGDSVGKAAYSFRQIAIRPVSVPVSVFRAFLQQISKLRSNADVTLISRFACKRQQGNNCARAP